MVLNKRLKKLLIIALAAVTIVWFIALYLHIQGYSRYMLSWHYIYDGIPIYAWRYAPLFIQSALIIFVTWAFVINSTRARRVFEIRWKYVLLITFGLTALSGLYVSHLSRTHSVSISFGFPFPWLAAYKSYLRAPAHWEYVWLEGLFADLLIYGLIAAIAVILYENARCIGKKRED